MFDFLKHFSILLVGIIGLVAVTIYADQIRQIVSIQVFDRFTDVKGVSTQVQDSSFSHSVKKEAQKDLQGVQQQVLQIKVGDVVNTFFKGQQIVHQVQTFPDTINQQLKQLAK